MFYISGFKIDWHGHLALDKEMTFTPGVNLLIGKNGSGKTSILRKIDGARRNENIGLDQEALNKYSENSEVAKLICKEENGSESTAVYRRQGNIAVWQNWQVLVDKTNFITSDRRITMASVANNPIPSIQRDIALPEVGVEIDISLEFTQAILKDLWERIEQTSSSETIATDILESYQNGLVDFEKTIRIDLKRPQNPIYFLDHRKREVQINDLSSGEKEYLYFYAFLRRMSNESNKVILIDEPELHLHSSQLRKLCELIMGLSEKNQIIIATHSGEILQSFITANIVSINRGAVVNIKSSVELKNALQEIGLPIDPSVFTSHWICAENDPSVPLKGLHSPRTPELLSWIFDNSINKKFWSFGQNKDNAEAVVSGVLETSAKPTPIRLSVILDGDKLVNSPSALPPIIPKGAEVLQYWPFWEIENIFLMPEILNKVIDQQGDKTGSEMFWKKVNDKKNDLYKQVHKTAVKNFLRTYRIDKIIDNNPEEDFENWKTGVSNLTFTHTKLQTAFSKIIREKNWRWIPGKESFSLVIELAPDFWSKFKTLVDSGELRTILHSDVALLDLDTKINGQSISPQS